MKKTAFIFPGQGSQYVGMGRGLWDGDEDVRRLYAEASEYTGIPLTEVSLEGPEATLFEDVTAQLAVFVCNEASRMAALKLGYEPFAVTGYSLGFYSALVASGVIGFREGLGAVMRAGELALGTSNKDKGGMGAVIGLGEDEVAGICEGVGGVWVSNVNAARQILISGSSAAVDRAVAAATEKGALSAYNLGMGAAYHSPLMEPTAGPLGEYLDGMDFSDPTLPLVSYLDATTIKSGAEAKSVAGTQLMRRVLWRDTVNAIAAMGADEFIEVGPGSALTRMVRWVKRDAAARSVEDLLGISAARDGVRR